MSCYAAFVPEDSQYSGDTAARRTAATIAIISSYLAGSRDRCVPIDVMTPDPPERVATVAEHAAHRDRHEKVAEDPPNRACGLAVGVASALGHYLLHPIATQPFVLGERLRHLWDVPQALGKRDRVLDRHGRALSRGRGDSVRGVSDNDHAVVVPGRDRRQVVRAPAGEDVFRVLNRVEGGRCVLGEQLLEPRPPLLWWDCSQLSAARVG